MQTPPPIPTPTQTQSIAEARELISFAARSAEALRSAEQRLSAVPEAEDERAWLAAAARRVERHAAHIDAAIANARALPEFEAERQAHGVALFDAWVDAALALLVGISSEASPNNPLIEILFPHQKFDKLRRGGMAGRLYMAELERRRRTAYVVRLAGEPEYAFLPPLLERMEAARATLELHEQPIELSSDELAALRHTVFVAADALRAVLHQARLLADAALFAYPGWFGELGLDLKPKKRVARSTTADAEPAGSTA